MKPHFIALFFLLPLFAAGQSRTPVDSLERVLPGQEGSARARTLFDLSYLLIRSDLDRSQKYLRELLQLRPSLDDAGKAYTYLAEGMFYNATGRLDSGMMLLDKAQSYATASKNYYALIKLYSAQSYSYIASGKAEKGLESLYKGLEIINLYPDEEMELRLRTNVTWAYLELKQYRNGIKSGLNNLRLMESSKKYSWISLYTYNNIAVCYGGVGKLDSAKYFVSKGMELARKNNDLQLLANSYFILGTIYSNAGEYQLAIEQYEQGMPIRQKVGNPLYVVSDLYTMADLYQKTGQFRKGVEVATEALKLVEQYDLTLKYENTYLALARNYEGLSDFRNAARFYKLYASAKDTVYTNANAKAIAEMETKYETEKKEKQLALQQVELVKKDARIKEDFFIIFLLAIVLVILMLVFSLVRSRMRRREIVLEKEKELEIREAFVHATIQSQETERKRFAEDLHDGMGQLITALRLLVHSISKGSSIDERIEVSEKSEKILDDMHHEIRSIAFNLMPQTLVKNGLVPALREMCDRINGTGRVQIQLNSFDMQVRLAEVIEVSLYRIIQEWINNVMKYSDAKALQLQLTGYDDECNVMIEDDGRGFNPLQLEQSKGNGWRNIKSRLSLIKGSIEIDSREGYRGTTVIVKVPVKKADRIVSESNQAREPMATVD